LSRNPRSATWQFRVGGELVEVNVKGRVSADSTETLLGLAIEGVGILSTVEDIAAEAIQKGQLEPLLQDFQGLERYPLWALLPPGRHQAPKVKVFLDFLIERVALHGGAGANPGRPGAAQVSNETSDAVSVARG
jgi:DNA-binding transcriptional LysR family regulator